MKKNIFLLLSFLHLMLHITAQTPEPKFSVKVLAGVSLPIGKFGDKSVYQDTGSTSLGWAKPGPAIQLAINYQVSKYFGVSLVLDGQENKQNANSVTNNYILHSHNLSDSDSYKTTVQAWKISKILAGGYFVIPFNKRGKLFFQPRITGGLLKTSFPGYSIIVYGLLNGVRVPGEVAATSSITLPWTFCYQAEASIVYRVNSKIHALVCLNYFHSAPRRSFDIYTFSTPASSKHYDVSYPVSSIGICGGVGIDF